MNGSVARSLNAGAFLSLAWHMERQAQKSRDGSARLAPYFT
jgi:hypothetical protein